MASWLLDIAPAPMRSVLVGELELATADLAQALVGVAVIPALDDDACIGVAHFQRDHCLTSAAQVAVAPSQINVTLFAQDAVRLDLIESVAEPDFSIVGEFQHCRRSGKCWQRRDRWLFESQCVFGYHRLVWRSIPQRHFDPLGLTEDVAFESKRAVRTF